jgi:hypothetical protein
LFGLAGIFADARFFFGMRPEGCDRRKSPGRNQGNPLLFTLLFEA